MPMDASENSKSIYLGDGLYASHDGYMIVLRAPRTEGDHWVGLEPRVLGDLLQWLQREGFIKDYQI